MNPFDLRKAIVEGNRCEKLRRQSFEAALRAINGENITVFSPNEKIAKEFIDAVKKKLIDDPNVFCHPSMFKNLKREPGIGK